MMLLPLTKGSARMFCEVEIPVRRFRGKKCVVFEEFWVSTLTYREQ